MMYYSIPFSQTVGLLMIYIACKIIYLIALVIGFCFSWVLPIVGLLAVLHLVTKDHLTDAKKYEQTQKTANDDIKLLR